MLVVSLAGQRDGNHPGAEGIDGHGPGVPVRSTLGANGGVGDTLCQSEERLPVGVAQLTAHAVLSAFPVGSCFAEDLHALFCQAIDAALAVADTHGDPSAFACGGEAAGESLFGSDALTGQIAVRDFAGVGDLAQHGVLGNFQLGWGEDEVIEVANCAAGAPQACEPARVRAGWWNHQEYPPTESCSCFFA